AGDDLFQNVSRSQFNDTGHNVITGGDGRDTYRLYVPTDGVVDVVTDFAAGEGGDLIDLSILYGSLTNYTTGTNPFASGHLRLTQDGPDVLLEMSADGTGAVWV